MFAPEMRYSQWRDQAALCEIRTMDVEALQQQMTELGVTNTDLAKVLGFPDPSYVSKILHRKRQLKAHEAEIIRSHMRKASTRAGAGLSDDAFSEIITDAAERAPPRANGAPASAMLPIRGTIQAGAWLAVDSYEKAQPERYPAVLDPRYPRAGQWLSRVIGDSMNALNIIEGDLAQLVNVHDIPRYAPRTDDVVEVVRTRFDGSEVEVTLKQVRVTNHRIELWPRSTNPRWSKPIEMRTGDADADGVTVQVAGLMVALIRTSFGGSFGR